MQEDLIVDTDPGMGFNGSDIDDNLSLPMAFRSSQIDVKLITLVYGNVELKKGYTSLLKFFELSGYRAPFSLGCQKPMFKKYISGRELILRIAEKQKLELDFASLLDERKIPPKRRVAPCQMLKTIAQNKNKLVLLTLGPLTNVALAILESPEAMKMLKRIVIMGGNFKMGISTGTSPCTEFNIATDPEAAKIVFNSGILITLVPLDVTTKVKIYYEEFEKNLKEKTPLNKFILRCAKNWTEILKILFYGEAFLNPHDSVALSYLIDKSLFQTQKAAVDIETKGELTYGQTLAYVSKERKTPVEICTDIDVDRFKQLFFELL